MIYVILVKNTSIYYFYFEYLMFLGFINSYCWLIRCILSLMRFSSDAAVGLSYSLHKFNLSVTLNCNGHLHSQTSWIICPFVSSSHFTGPIKMTQLNIIVPSTWAAWGWQTSISEGSFINLKEMCHYLWYLFRFSTSSKIMATFTQPSSAQVGYLTNTIVLHITVLLD